jgi:hypothetical protein
MNPRVQVTLSPSLDALLVRLATHQGSSKSQVLRELFEAAEPALHRVVALMDAAATAKDEVHTGLARSLDRAQDAIEDGLAIAIHRLDAAIPGGDLVRQAEGVRGRRRRRGAVEQHGGGAALTPVPVTRGSGTGKTRRSNGRKGGRHGAL